MNEQTPEPEHWPTERMILEGHADYATLEDIEALDDGLLLDIAALCQVDEFAPDECIPCLAHTMYLDRQKEEEPSLPGISEAMEMPLDPDGLLAGNKGYEPYPSGPDPWFILQNRLEEVQQLLAEAIGGPPIPPKDVTLAELAALVIGAEKWVKMIDAQELELSPEQEAVKEEIQRVIAKVRPAGS